MTTQTNVPRLHKVARLSHSDLVALRKCDLLFHLRRIRHQHFGTDKPSDARSWTGELVHRASSLPDQPRDVQTVRKVLNDLSMSLGVPKVPDDEAAEIVETGCQQLSVLDTLLSSFCIDGDWQVEESYHWGIKDPDVTLVAKPDRVGWMTGDGGRRIPVVVDIKTNNSGKLSPHHTDQLQFFGVVVAGALNRSDVQLFVVLLGGSEPRIERVKFNPGVRQRIIDDVRRYLSLYLGRTEVKAHPSDGCVTCPFLGQCPDGIEALTRWGKRPEGLPLEEAG